LGGRCDRSRLVVKTGRNGKSNEQFKEAEASVDISVKGIKCRSRCWVVQIAACESGGILSYCSFREEYFVCSVCVCVWISGFVWTIYRHGKVM